MLNIFKLTVKNATISVVALSLLAGNAVDAYSLTTHSTLTFGAGNGAIAGGSDGYMWFTENNSKKIAKISSSGITQEYTVPENRRPFDIVQGSDGLMWFTAGGKIATIDENGAITYVSSSEVDNARDLILGSDNTIWFTEYWNNSWSIGRIDTSGVVTHHLLPNDKSRVDIALGSDGALWFIEYSNDSDAAIGRMTTSGQYSSYPVPTHASYPSGITSGPDGALWFTETNAGKIGRITTSGVVTEYDTPDNIHPGSAITSGPDGALWFVSGADYSIFRMTTSGEVTKYPVQGGVGGLSGIASDGVDGIWFTNYSTSAEGSYVGHIKLDLKSTTPTNLRAKTPFPSAVLTWDSVPKAKSYDVFRDDSKIANTNDASFTDSTAMDGTHSYHVVAVSAAGISSSASNRLNVQIDNIKPTISHSFSPTLRSNGWSNSNMTTTFTCNDDLSGVQSCSSPVSVTTEGANQEVNGAVTDNAGNSAAVSVKVNIDKTAPVISNPSMSNTSFISSSNQTLTANAADSLSGISKGEYYIDTDPGLGKGLSMAYVAGKLKATTTINNLSIGQHKLYMRSQDVAGNWSIPAAITFTNQAPTIVNIIQNAISMLLRALLGLFFGMFLLS